MRRYVKFYKDPSQAYSEAVANRAYNAMGLHAPRSTLVYQGDEVVGVANEIIDHVGTLGEKALTTTKAKDTLHGFVSDVWLANWDAVGSGLDNVVAFRRGQGIYIARIDQGGSLLFRAQAGRKADDLLGKITEWEGFSSPGTNPSYARLFQQAGLQGGDDLGQKALSQIKRIQELGKRTNDFEDLVPKTLGVSEADRQAILKMLRGRAKALQDDIAPRVRAALKAKKEAAKAGKAKPAQKAPGYTPEQEKEFVDWITNHRSYSQYIENTKQALRRAKPEIKVLSESEALAILAYTGDAFEDLNPNLWKIYKGRAMVPRKSLWQSFEAILRSAIAKLPRDTRPIKRTITQSNEFMRKTYKPGAVVHWPGASSGSATKINFRDRNVYFHIRKQKSGAHVQDLSEHWSEDEVLLPPGLQVRVIDARFEASDGIRGRWYVTVEEVDE